MRHAFEFYGVVPGWDQFISIMGVIIGLPLSTSVLFVECLFAHNDVAANGGDGL